MADDDESNVIHVNFKKWKRIVPKKKKLTPNEFTRAALGRLLPATKKES